MDEQTTARTNTNSLLPHGAIYLLNEILADVHSKDGVCVRVFGRLKNMDGNIVKIEYKQDVLSVDISFVDSSCTFTINSLFQFIGEIEIQKNQPILKARVARNIDGLDISLYERSLSLRREFEASQQLNDR